MLLRSSIVFKGQFVWLHYAWLLLLNLLVMELRKAIIETITA